MVDSAERARTMVRQIRRSRRDQLRALLVRAMPRYRVGDRRILHAKSILRHRKGAAKALSA
jgi:hypothetical protein